MSESTDGTAAYAQACQRDRNGDEAEAIPFYEEALRLGLPQADRRGALLGLGSSLRNVGRHDDAVATLERAVAEFPDDAALRAFLSLALYSKGNKRAAMVELLDLTIKYAPVGQYSRALRGYRDSLD
jgi:tetratricopeptide (TPR) repeat protein